MTRQTKRDLVTLAGALLVAALLVMSVRRPLWEVNKQVRETSDVYFLPAPDQVMALSMGYRYALADVLWAHVMVSQGYHSFERRRFENLTLLYDAINTLDPEWRTPYLMADALITFQAQTTPFEEVVKVREILERSVEHLPYDAEMWLALGQFVAYVAPPSYLEDKPEVAAAWRRDGLRYLSRAAELCGGDANICWQALGGASMLARHGEREASIRFLQRTYAVTDDEDLKKEILGRLEKLMAERDLQAYKGRDEAFRSLVEGELPYLTRDEALVLGPPPSPARCAGPQHANEPGCAIDWRQWSERYQRAQQSQ